MKVRDYLSEKYGSKDPTTLSYVEARIFGIDWPPSTGWLSRLGDAEITAPMHAELVNALKMAAEGPSARKALSAKNGLAALGLGERPATRFGWVWAPETKASKKQRKKPVAKAALAKAREAWAANPTQHNKANSDSFLSSYEWRRVRMVALKRHGARCQCCGASPATGAVLNVDHIKPRRLFPHLALDVDNLQVLCAECNHGKEPDVIPMLREIAKHG